MVISKSNNICAPTGANVYYFKNNNGGLLEWTQRRSYGGMGKNIIYILMKNKNGWVKNNPLRWSKFNQSLILIPNL